MTRRSVSGHRLTDVRPIKRSHCPRGYESGMFSAANCSVASAARRSFATGSARPRGARMRPGSHATLAASATLAAPCARPWAPLVLLPLRQDAGTTSVFLDFHRAWPGWDHNWPATCEGQTLFPDIASDSLRESEAMSGSVGIAVFR